MINNQAKNLINFMHTSGFDWICAIASVSGAELVASKINNSDDLWWRRLEVEGSGFERLFKGSIKQISDYNFIYRLK